MRRACATVAGGASARLNATSGARAQTRVAPALGCRRAGPKSGAQLAGGDALGEPGDPAGAQLRARPSAGELAVEEDGNRQLLADPVGEDERLRDRGAAGGGVEVDDRRDVERAHVGMLAARLRAGGAGEHVDPRHGLACARQQGVRQRARRAGEGVDRAVVVGVAVDVQEADILAAVANAPVSGGGWRRRRARWPARWPGRGPRRRWGRPAGGSRGVLEILERSASRLEPR